MHDTDKIVLFGGKENFTSTGERDDTWIYDENADTWTELFPVSAPSARRGHIMAYDSESDRIVLFGGMAGWPLTRSGPVIALAPWRRAGNRSRWVRPSSFGPASNMIGKPLMRWSLRWPSRRWSISKNTTGCGNS